MNYNLNTDAAKKADQFFAKIETTGAYLGTFTRAEAVTSKKGTHGVDFSFKAEGGETADYLTLWTHNADGKELMGYNTLMAIMTCLSLRTLKHEPGEIEKYDNDTKSRIKVTVPLYKALMGKPIGLLLQMEEYPKTAGGTGWKPTIFGPFNADGFTASEILNKAKEPEAKAKMVAALRDKPIKGAPSPAVAAAERKHESMGSGFSDFEDDIPF